MYTAHTWQMPRTMTTGGMLDSEVRGQRTDTPQSVAAKIMKHVHNKQVPRYIRELRYNLALSGLNMGPNRHRDDKRLCPRCRVTARRRTRGPHTEWEETIPHAYLDCTKELWRLAFAWWKRQTGETIGINKASTILGIRNIHTQMHGHTTEIPSFCSLEEPFAFLHAAVTHTIAVDSRRTEAGGPPRPMHRLWILATRRRELLRLATAHYHVLRAHYEARDPEMAD